jgi:glycosyltransferase involved in cell wall biosynthesis
MNNKPLVSCIIVFLNAEKFIGEAIESILAQTYNHWELLLVDDGSTDASTRIALRYVEHHSGKIRYLEHPGHQNRGVSASRNLGISHARGEYIGFLDADDVRLSYALEQQVAILDSHPEADMVYGSTQIWYSWTGKPEDSHRDFRTFVENQPGVKPNTLLEPPAGLLTTLLRPKGVVPAICSVLIRRETVKSVGGFEEKFRVYEDQALYIKIGLQAPVFVASECWSKYRQHPESSWHTAVRTHQKQAARVLFLNWIAEYLYGQGVENIDTWKLLQEAQLRTHSKQLEQLERAVEKERRKVRRLILRIQDLEQQTQNRLPSGTRILSKSIDHVRARVLGR